MKKGKIRNLKSASRTAKTIVAVVRNFQFYRHNFGRGAKAACHLKGQSSEILIVFFACMDWSTYVNI
jgi:hypothetical protein